MIHHISIPATDPRRVAAVIAELWRGTALPFPPSPGAYVVMPKDAYGTAVEVFPAGDEAAGGGGAQTRAAFSVPVDEDSVREIAAREGWRVELVSRGEAFEVLELWIEDRLRLELLTPELVPQYLDFMMPRKYAALFGNEPPPDARRPELRAA